MVKYSLPLSKHSRLMKGIPAEHKDRQKSIPVGCVPPAFVVLGVGYIPPWIPYHRMSYPLDALPQIHYSPWIPYLYPLDTLPLSPVYPTPTPRRNTGPEIPYPPERT